MFSVFMQMPEPELVLQVFLTQHWMSAADRQEKTVEKDICRRRAKELERPAPKGNAKG